MRRWAVIVFNKLANIIENVQHSFKSKLILSFLFIVIITGSISILSFSSLRSYLTEEDQMIERTIAANQIVTSSQTITTIISGYVLTNMPDYKEKKASVFKEIQKMKRNTEKLDSVIVDANARKRVEEIEALIADYEENLKNIYITSESNKLGETARYKDKSMKIASWIQDTVARLISFELSYQQVIKADLNKRANWVGVSVYGLILLVSGLSIIFAIAFSRRAGGDIVNLARVARKIAEGNLEIERFSVKSKDEIAILSDSFNYMVTHIKKLIDGISEKANIEKRLKDQEIKNLEFSNLLNEAELRFLQSQINPHFLFNTMNTIASMAKAQKADDIKRMIESVADILRYNLKKLDETVTLAEEFEMVKNYIFIQKMRFGEKIKYAFNIDDGALDYKVPSMILQPFVENAVIHGLEPKEEEGLMELNILDRDEIILVVIKDNGIGMNSKILNDIINNRGKMSEDSRMGIGVNNVIRRLELTFGKNVIEIESKIGQGTEVRIKLYKEFIRT